MSVHCSWAGFGAADSDVALRVYSAMYLSPGMNCSGASSGLCMGYSAGVFDSSGRCMALLA